MIVVETKNFIGPMIILEYRPDRKDSVNAEQIIRYVKTASSDFENRVVRPLSRSIKPRSR